MSTSELPIALSFAPDVDARPRHPTIVTLPQGRSRLAVSSHEKAAVRMLDDHRFAAYDVEMVDVLSDGQHPVRCRAQSRGSATMGAAAVHREGAEERQRSKGCSTHDRPPPSTIRRRLDAVQLRVVPA